MNKSTLLGHSVPPRQKDSVFTRISPINCRFWINCMFLIAMLALTTTRASAQCTGCTRTISTNTAITVNPGDVVCITAATFSQSIASYTGTSTICIAPGTTVSSAITLPPNVTLNVYGTYTGSFAMNGGNVNIYSGGVFTPAYDLHQRFLLRC